MKGFIQFDKQIHNVEKNIMTYRNIISPFSKPGNIKVENGTGNSFLDEYYGLVYDDYYLDKDTAIYGIREMIPDYSGDSLANYGFLRVPFRKIPRIYINNREELMEIISGIDDSYDKNLRVLYRGQFQEHYTDRDKETLYAIYGDENALEPSLVTSAARKNLRLEDILPSWLGVLNIYIENILDKLPDAEKEKTGRPIRNFQASSNFNVFGMAMAQHYGLPSIGLDLTPDIDVALFFALRKFTPSETPLHYQYLDVKVVKPSQPPVIYLMAPTEDQQLDYFQFKPSILPFMRPDKQSAKFIHTGWGSNKNFAATRIFGALYLNPDGDFGPIKEASELFPSDDSFADHVHYFRENRLHDDPLFTKFLETFYIVK